MILTVEERDMLDGGQGQILQKVMRTLVAYGQALEAERFVAIEGDGHFAIPGATPGVGPRLEMLDELVEAGLRTKYPFTLDPRAPLDFENLGLTPEQTGLFEEMYRDQARYDQRMLQLGLRDAEAYTCTPYLPEIGNAPKKGTILAWSESSCVVYANSILGARTNRNAAIMDLLSNIVGKTPLAGLLTDKGRRATGLVMVETSSLPNPQLLGAAIGMSVGEGVPYILGLDRFLNSRIDDESLDYLKELGAACAAIGAVGLYHIDRMTPEAIEKGMALLTSSHRTIVIRDQDLTDLLASYAIMWPDKNAKPRKCFIGCPHLTLTQLVWWADRIHERLREVGQGHVAVETVLCAAPQVLRTFRANTRAYAQLIREGVKLSATCPEAYMENDLCARERVVTNSNKLRAFTPARLFLDDELLEVIVSGMVNKENRHG